MLDPSRKKTVSLPRRVHVYPDCTSAARFYAVPAEPRVVRDADGWPRASLTLFERGEGAARKIAGGGVMLTVSLGFTRAERSSLRGRLADEGTGAPEAEDVVVVSPDWTEGEVTAELTAGVRLRGRPSMVGENECVLASDLSPDGARALRRAWLAGLPDARICYRVRALAGKRRTGGGEREGGRRGAGHRVRFAYAAGEACPWNLQLAGPPALSEEELRAGLTVVRLE